MHCKNCGTEIKDGDQRICPNCHQQLMNKIAQRFLPSFILGLIGSLFGIAGGFCMTMCSSLYSSGVSAFVLIFGGSVVGLIGACQCLKNVKIGAILEIIAAIMITICAYGPIGGDLATVLAMILFYISGIVGIIYYIYKIRK